MCICACRCVNLSPLDVLLLHINTDMHSAKAYIDRLSSDSEEYEEFISELDQADVEVRGMIRAILSDLV